MVRRWTAAGMLAAERSFRRVKCYKACRPWWPRWPITPRR
jgi:hypothetical protein